MSWISSGESCRSAAIAATASPEAALSPAMMAGVDPKFLDSFTIRTRSSSECRPSRTSNDSSRDPSSTKTNSKASSGFLSARAASRSASSGRLFAL